MWSRTLSRTPFRGALTAALTRSRTVAVRPGCAPHRTTALTSSVALWVATRRQSSLQDFLEDRNDPYMAPMQDFDIPRIARVVDAGPDNTAVPTAFLQRMGIRVDNDRAEARRAKHAEPTPLTSRLATSSAEAVLQSLHAVGVQRQQEAAAELAAERWSAQDVYDALTAEEKAVLQKERMIAHLFDGVCAISAAIRIQAEEGTASPEEVEAVYHVYETVVRAYERGDISAERWAADFAAEMAELEVIWKHIGNPRPLPVKA